MKVTIKAKEAISNVKVKIQGLDAAVVTQDNINWTATATMNGVQTGKVAFAIDYQKKDGTSGDTTYLTTDDSKLFLVDRAAFLNVPMLAKVTASDVQFPGTGLSKEQVGYLLFDGNANTYGDLNTGSGSYYTIDFGADATVKLNEILLMPRSNFPERMNGLVVQGSNDNVNWTNLTTGAKGTQANVWTVYTGSDMQSRNPYRYVRLYNSNGWFGNVAEVEFYGDYVASAASAGIQNHEHYGSGQGCNPLDAAASSCRLFGRDQIGDACRHYRIGWLDRQTGRRHICFRRIVRHQDGGRHDGGYGSHQDVRAGDDAGCENQRL